MGLTGIVVPVVYTQEQRQPQTLVEEGVPDAVNLKAWNSFYEARGCKTARDRRRADRVAADALRGLRIDDVSVVRMLGKLAAAVRSPYSLKVLAAMEECGWTPEFLNKIPSVDPSDYSDASSYFWDNQVAKLLSKYPFEGFDEVAEERAVQSFLASESRNKLTNQRWRGYSAVSPEIGLIEAVSRQLELILGSPPALEEICQRAVWGPGTNVGFAFPSGWTGAELKYLGPLTCYPHLIPIASQCISLISESWSDRLTALWGRQKRLQIVEQSELFTVFKRWDTKRTAIKEASLNSLLQRGLGILIRDRFDAFTGRKLRFQPAINQEYARIGSLTDLFCTVDLSSASDSVCRSVVASVVPVGWSDWLEGLSAREYALPSPKFDVDGVKTTGKFEMLSSMGNGFTFEFESVLFYSIVTAVVPGIWHRSPEGKITLSWPHVHVFGDDIIFPSAYYEAVLDALTTFGLVVNQDKTFVKGSFRESCGADWFLGENVRPLYFTRRLDEGSALLGLANRTVSFAHDYPSSRGCIHDLGDHRFGDVHKGLVSYVPKWLRALVETPPHVVHGLWTRWGDRTWETESGQPIIYRLPGTIPTSIDLRYYSGWPSDDGWPVRCDTWNLIYTRISSLSSDPGSGWDKDVEVVSSGNETTKRRGWTYKVIKSTCSEVSRWGPLAILAY